MIYNSSFKTVDYSTYQSKQYLDKSFKFFNYIYNQNLQTFIRNNRRALEEVQLPPKIRLKRQDQLFLNTNRLSIIEQNIDIAVKQALDKNNFIQKVINQYQQQVSKVYPIQNNHKDQQIQTNKKDYLDQQINLSKKDFDQALNLTDKGFYNRGKLKAKTFINIKISKIKPSRTNSLIRPNDNYSFETMGSQDKRQLTQTAIEWRKPYLPKKSRTRNYSLYSETQLQENNRSSEILEKPIVKQQNQLKNSLKHETFYDCNINSFVPFEGLNKSKRLMFKKRLLSKNQKDENIVYNNYSVMQQNSSKEQQKSYFKWKKAIHKRNEQRFALIDNIKNHKDTVKDMRSLNYLFTNQSLIKNNSDLVVKTLEPRGYGKYKSRNKQMLVQK